MNVVVHFWGGGDDEEFLLPLSYGVLLGWDFFFNFFLFFIKAIHDVVLD